MNREAMLQAIDSDMQETEHYTGINRLDDDVRQALAEVPRHLFVPAAIQASAYENRPLPIGHDQTISQPFIVALMTQLARPKNTDTVLEVGTGSGYQAAVLAPLVKQVYSIEIIEPLAIESAKALAAAGYDNVTVACRDGHAGWPEMAAFDIIIVTAAAEKLPDKLLEQLAPGGRMVIPLGDYEQWLTVATKQENGDMAVEKILPVRFVPFV